MEGLSCQMKSKSSVCAYMNTCQAGATKLADICFMCLMIEIEASWSLHMTIVTRIP